MQRSKKIFFILAAIFMTIVAFISYDFGRRTTFPGSKPQLQERIKKQFFDKDSADRAIPDSARRQKPAIRG